MFTDASFQGWGVVILRPSTIEIHAGQWAFQENIAILEARALLLAVRALPDVERCLLKLMVDNTTVVGSVRRTRCAKFHHQWHRTEDM